MNKVLSTKAFTLSMISIFVLSLAVLGVFYYFLHDGRIPLLANQGFNNYIPVTKEPISFSFEINNPDDDTLVYDKTLVISGKTAPNVVIVISNDKENIGLQANQKGDFSKVINLNPGLNIVQVTALDDEGNKKTETRNIFYSTEKI